VNVNGVQLELLITNFEIVFLQKILKLFFFLKQMGCFGDKKKKKMKKFQILFQMTLKKKMMMIFIYFNDETEIILNTLKRKQEENQFSESLKLKK
jgi:hypothetical protein